MKLSKVSPLLPIWFFNLALVIGITLSQIISIHPFRNWVYFLADTLLAYIMMEVGLEFLIEKKKWKNYLVDYGVATLAAALSWMLCFLYFQGFDPSNWKENLLLSLFAAPTATGILFTMLGLAGLGMTWLFKKIEVLVILDDLDTILFLIPIQFLLSGGYIELIIVALFMLFLVMIGWRYMHRLQLPCKRPWIFLYAILIALLTEWLELNFGLEIEVLLPAFIIGLLLYNPKHSKKAYPHEHAYFEPEERRGIIGDRIVKLFFMLLVGLLLPKVALNQETIWQILIHVLFLTLLMCMGKLAPLFFYRKQASFRERVAVGFGMMPRGEMGAGILTIALAHGINTIMSQAAVLALALNLFLTGFFIWIVILLLKPNKKHN